MMSFEKWKANRAAEVQGAQGDLTLVGMFEINTEQRVDGIPGVWSPIAIDKPGLKLRIDQADLLYMNGQSIQGEVTLVADETIVYISDSLTLTATSQPGSMHLLALWDTNSDAMRNFQEISTFPFNEELIIEGKLVVDQQDDTYQFAHTGDSDHRLRTHQSAGEVHFQYAGVQAVMRPFASGDYMILVFRDATSGKESYGLGRMLIIEKPINGNKVILDFNQSFLPPCAFSYHFNCPMPPASNVISVAIAAGEKNIIWKNE